MTEWFAVRTRPGAEGKALIGAEATGLQGFLPVELVRAQYRGSRALIWQPLFSRYIFVQCDLGRDYARLAEVDGIMKILRSPISPAAVDAIQRAERSGLFDRTRAARLGAGDTVRVIEGPLASFIGKIRSARPSKRVELITKFPFRVTVGIDKLEKIGK